MKICTKCGIRKDLSLFSKQSKSKDGLRFRCKQCCNQERKIYHIKNKDKENANIKKYSELNSEKVKLKNKIWTANTNKKKEWQQINSDKVNAKNAKYRAIKLNATPKWLTEEHLKEIETFYTKSKELEKENNIKYHVDHIIPLQGKTVSGLHVPWNLRVITAEENVSKNNKLIEGIL